MVTIGGPDRDQLSLLAPLDQRGDVTIPRRHGGLYLALVSRAIINSRDAAAVAGSMVEDFLDHMRRDSEVRHARGGRPSQIVQRPLANAVAGPGIQRPLMGRP